MEFNVFLNMTLALFSCLLAGKLMKKFHLPNVTGYLIIGLFMGPSIFNLFNKEAIEHFSFISELALGFIAFSIGAEFKLSYLKRVGKLPVIIAITEALGAVLLVDFILIITGHNVPFALVLGAIAAATAPAATLMVVRQYRAKGPVTDTLLPVVAIDDAVALLTFGLSVAVAKAIASHGHVSLGETLLTPLIEIVGALVFGAILGVLLKFLTDWFSSHGNRLSISIAMIALSLGVAQVAGFSTLLTCMAISAVYVNLTTVSNQVFELVDRLTPPLFMLFFFLSGAELDILILPTVGVIGILYIIFRVLGKVSGAALGAHLSHGDPVVKKYLGFTLIPQAGVAIGLASVAMTVVPEYGQQIKTIILCGTIIYELIGPLTTKLALKKAGEIL
jgi:Kef-type K+ transport system membrane component KefB